MSAKVFASIVTYNHSTTIHNCLTSLVNQEGFSTQTNLTVHVVDNASTDETLDTLKQFETNEISYLASTTNLGFSAANNIAAASFIRSECDFFLLLNPDLKLELDCLRQLCSRIKDDPDVDFATPLLLQADSKLQPVEPLRIDSAGMTLHRSLRHFDRGQGLPLKEPYTTESLVFGATGACLLMKRSCVLDLLLRGEQYDQDFTAIYPALEVGASQRAPLFDEAFFAYREDADLCWRAQILGKNCLYYPSARGYHIRKVTPDKRAQLAPEINYLGVRNRFLLQLNNYHPLEYPETGFQGFVWRNLVVLLAVFTLEWRSVPALIEVFKLKRRARERYRLLLGKTHASHHRARLWIKHQIKI